MQLKVLTVDELKRLYKFLDPNIRIEYTGLFLGAIGAVHEVLPHISIVEIYLALKDLVIAKQLKKPGE